MAAEAAPKLRFFMFVRIPLLFVFVSVMRRERAAREIVYQKSCCSARASLLRWPRGGASRLRRCAAARGLARPARPTRSLRAPADMILTRAPSHAPVEAGRQNHIGPANVLSVASRVRPRSVATRRAPLVRRAAHASTQRPIKPSRAPPVASEVPRALDF